MADVEDVRGEEEDDLPAGPPGPALHTAGLPGGESRPPAGLQEEHQPDQLDHYTRNIKVSYEGIQKTKIM